MASSITFHESYGDVSVAQLRAYKTHNVSPMDHQHLVDLFAGDHALITKTVKDKRFHAAGSKSFSLWMLINR
jgi:hypothetical protein